MAQVFDLLGERLSDILPGSNVSDEAALSAERIAHSIDEPVILRDDDGLWLVHPNGARTRRDPRAIPLFDEIER